MKVRSDIRPIDIIIEVDGEKVVARFTENIVEKTDENGNIYFEYDEYVFETFAREGLEQEIRQNFEVWLSMAKSREETILHEKYRCKVQEFIRQKYTEHDEAKLINEALTDYMEGRSPSQEYIGYRTYVEECKERARQLVYTS